MTKTIGYAASNHLSDLKPITIERREPQATDVDIEILFCGVCHSDVHQVLNEWHNTIYPCMPGHEVVGRVRRVGASVTKHKVGDLVGVGCMVDSCHHCKACAAGLENYCENGFTATYNGNMRKPDKDNQTYGGYSQSIVVREDFVLKIPANLDPAGAAPLLCAGITTYSPLKYWKAGPGTQVGIAGFGGLGQMALKIARAMGATVTVITRNADKHADAMRLGASRVIVSTNETDMKGAANSLDLILSTIPTAHDANLYLPLLGRDGVYTVVGCLVPLAKPLEMMLMNPDRKAVASTLIGSIAETQEVLDFCGKHGIVSDIEVIPVDKLNDAYKKVDLGTVALRYVIDMATIKAS